MHRVAHQGVHPDSGPDGEKVEEGQQSAGKHLLPGWFLRSDGNVGQLPTGSLEAMNLQNGSFFILETFRTYRRVEENAILTNLRFEKKDFIFGSNLCPLHEKIENPSNLL